MAKALRRLILGNGEAYIDGVQKSFGGPRPAPPRSYDQARQLVRQDLTRSLATMRALPATRVLPDSAVLCLRLHPDATAKSFDPESLFADARQLRKVGSRNYRGRFDSVAKTPRTERESLKQPEFEGRLVFVQSSLQGFNQFLRDLDRPESEVPRGVREELQRIERFDLLSPAERIVGFSEGWRGGRVELVFHPTREVIDNQQGYLFELFEEVGVHPDRRRVRAYSGGPTFVSCSMSPEALRQLAEVNPLRAAHPLEFGGLERLRGAPTAPAPSPPSTTTKSTIKVGMFDGGVDLTVPHLHGFVEQDDTLSIGSPADPEMVAHGTAVAGAILYGPLNHYAPGSRLPPPPVSVVSFRALPPANPRDWDLYESIDVIERAVPARPDIKIFNISFGPRGPILDDTISRFTYVLDNLSVSHKVGFVVAVGNDGEAGGGMDRIQAPADLVNGLGVGAFSLATGNPGPTTYSCKGPGRECGKIKPDVSAFGGCPGRPFHLLSTRHGQKSMWWGTSFAAPLVSRVSALGAESFDRSSSLVSRALVVHFARHPNNRPDHLFGHGCAPEDIEELVSCDSGSVTVVFQNAIIPRRVVKLPIPLPDAAAGCRVSLSWTVAGLPPVDPNHPSDYTAGCLEDTFYPHSRRFKLTDPADKKRSKVLDLTTDAVEVAALQEQGWRIGEFPDSDSGNQYRHEATRRSLDCKWEPVVRRQKSKQPGNLWRPFLTLHAIGRNSIPDRFDYAVVVTLKAHGYAGDLYTDIRTQFPALAPIRLRTEAEIRVQI